jgi:hypothetical protein
MDGENTCPTCNRELPAQDLAIHKQLCAQFSSLPPKADPNYILGLVFPHNPLVSENVPAPAPCPTWIKRTSSTDDETSITFQSVDVSPVFASYSAAAAPEVIYTERNTVRNRDTASMIEIWSIPSTSSSVAEDENTTVKALARGRDGPFHAWTGPVLALAMTRATGFMVDPGSYRDVSLGDAADVVDFLVDYENPEHGRRIREALDMLAAERPEDEGKREADDAQDEGDVPGEAGVEKDGEIVFEVM